MFAGREKAMKNAFAFLLLLTISAFAQTNRVIPEGTEIKVRTDSAIPAKPAAGSAYSATVSQHVQDSSGATLIPRGSPARLVAVKNGNDTTLDLRSVTIDGRRYAITGAGGKSTPGGLGANKRTAKYVGGGRRRRSRPGCSAWRRQGSSHRGPRGRSRRRRS